MQKSIVGISFGTRTIGIAVWRNNRLIDWQVKSYKLRMSEHKKQTISASLLRLIHEYDCIEVACKFPSTAQAHTGITALIKYFLQTLASHNISVSTYTLVDIKKALSVPVTNKKELCRFIAATYPTELRLVYQRHCESRNLYYSKLFEAVAVGHIHIHRT